MSLLQNITKESDPVRQRHYTTKRLWLVDFTNIFWFILKLFLLQQQILCFYSFYQYWHWNLYIPFDFYISTFCLGLPQNPSISFTTHVPMQKLIIPTLWISQLKLLWEWYRIHWQHSRYFFVWMIHGSKGRNSVWECFKTLWPCRT